MSDQAPTTKEIIERHVHDITWRGLRGYCTCPGAHLHTTPSTKKDCIIYTEGVPTIYCFHEHCQELISDLNHKVREEWSVFQPEVPADELEKSRAAARHKHELEHKAKMSLPTILNEFKWTESDIRVAEKGCCWMPKELNQWHTFLGLFNEDDIVWVGQPETTGHYTHAVNFRPVKQWKLLPEGPQGNFTCPSTFRRGSISRANANVVSTPYLVVEGDTLFPGNKQANRDACGAIFNWLQKSCGLKLRAVIDSGNKSLHGWFEMPKKEVYDELKVVLPAMGCDRAMFKPSQPVRAPGAIRKFEDGRTAQQSLLYYV